MKPRIVYMQTDFGPYKVPLIIALQQHVAANGGELIAIEGAGKGGLYREFFFTNERPEGWMCLWEDRHAYELGGRAMAKAFYRALNSLQPDVVMSGTVAFPSGASAVVWGLRNSKPTILIDAVRRRNVSSHPAVNLGKRWFHRNCDAVFVSSQAFAPDYEYWGIPRERQFYGFNAMVNTPWIERTAHVLKSAHEYRSSLGLPQRFFLGVGRQVPSKNWPRCVKAYREYAAASSEPWALVLIGNGPDHAQIYSLAQNSGPGCVMLKDFLPHEQLSAYYTLCSSFILPSKNEPWGYVVNEAACSGAPLLVSSECGSSCELVREGENGFLLDPYETRSITQAMFRMASLPEEKRRSMSEASRRIAEGWDANRFLDGAWGAIQFCLSHPKRRGPWWTRALLPLWKGRYRPV